MFPPCHKDQIRIQEGQEKKPEFICNLGTHTDCNPDLFPVASTGDWLSGSQGDTHRKDIIGLLFVFDIVLTDLIDFA